MKDEDDDSYTHGFRTSPEFNAQLIVDHIQLRWKDIPCPMCKSNSWVVYDREYKLVEFNKKSSTNGKAMVPVVPVSCKNCGNTLLVNRYVYQHNDRLKARAEANEVNQ